MRRSEELPLLGGALCLDFANTLEYRGSPRELDALRSPGDLVRWGIRAGAVGRAGAPPEGRDEAAPSPDDLHAARRFREAIYAVFSAVAAGGDPERARMDDLNRPLAPRLARTEMRMIRRDSPTRAFAGPAGGPEQILWAVAWSVHDLLLSDELSRVRECLDEECHWLFVDRSRNRSRRWCDMANCGNLAKVRRFRRRP